MAQPGGNEGKAQAAPRSMKSSPWFLTGAGLAILAGLAFVWVGLTRPGQPHEPENVGGSGKPWLAEAKRKVQALRETREQLRQEQSGWTGFQGKEDEHRVFVSAQLVYLPQNPEPVQPLDRKMKTDDGLEIGWKMRYGFDPADPAVANQDPDGDGFTNLEEYAANPSTDPLRKEDSPAKESKLKSRSGDPLAINLTFPEKSGGLFTIRFQVGPKRRDFKGQPGSRFWVMAGPEGVEVFPDEPKMKAARDKARDSGKNTHVIPFQFVSYEEKIEIIRDVKAGGVEVEVDNSKVVLEREDALAGPVELIFSSSQRPRVLSFDGGDILLHTPAGGGTTLGPFRLGETFVFEEKEFSVVGREGKKIQLLNRTDPERKTFWVPPELESSSGIPAP